MSKIIFDHYSDFLGESGVVICRQTKSIHEEFHVWDGYFQPILDSLPTPLPDAILQWEKEVDDNWVVKDTIPELFNIPQIIASLKNCSPDNMNEYKDMRYWDDCAKIIEDLVEFLVEANNKGMKVTITSDEL